MDNPYLGLFFKFLEIIGSLVKMLGVCFVIILIMYGFIYLVNSTEVERTFQVSYYNYAEEKLYVFPSMPGNAFSLHSGYIEIRTDNKVEWHSSFSVIKNFNAEKLE